MNSKIEKVLEFSKIRTQLAEYATSEKGKQMIKELPIEVEAKAIQHKRPSIDANRKQELEKQFELQQDLLRR